MKSYIIPYSRSRIHCNPVKYVELAIYLVNYNDLTVLPHWNQWFLIGKSSPFMAQLFRLEKYYNLPRTIQNV